MPTFSKLKNVSLKSALAIFIASSMLSTGCKKADSTTTTSTTAAASYQLVNLVSDTPSFGALRTDPKLVDAWGMAIGSTGAFWISANGTGSTVIYDNNGAQLSAPVSVPLGALPNGASPSGVVFNTTSDFAITAPGSGTSLFIYCTENGILSAWNAATGVTTQTVADRSAVGAVYKGIAIGSNGGSNFIYATDFHNAKVDVYDNTFTYVSTIQFTDPTMPAGFAPFNIQNIGGQLYITYAKQKGPLKHDDLAGAGNGYIDIFTTAGGFVSRFASQGTLNSPWGIVQAPSGFGQAAGSILVGNFGDGRINVFNASGAYQGQLMNGSTAITVQGLWALTFDNVSPADPNLLYFTAGPDAEAHGLFGYLKKM